MNTVTITLAGRSFAVTGEYQPREMAAGFAWDSFEAHTVAGVERFDDEGEELAIEAFRAATGLPADTTYWDVENAALSAYLARDEAPGEARQVCVDDDMDEGEEAAWYAELERGYAIDRA